MHTLAGHSHAIRALAYTPGTQALLASAGDDRSIRLWDPALGQQLALLECRRDGILALAFSPDGRHLASGGRAGSLSVWDVTGRTQTPGTSQCAGPVVAVS